MENLSIILPCLNEEKSIGRCIDSIKQNTPKNTEIIVVDNGSKDRSKEIALNKNVTIISEPKKGYGNAYKKGLSIANNKNIIMVDCDCSYNYNDIPRFIDNLNNHDLVIGNRFAKPDKGAMHPLNKIGNLILKILLRFKGVKYTEVCTGFVGIKKNKIPKDLKSPGMEFSSEFLIKTKNLNSKEIPIRFHKRIGKPKLKRFKDGFRHVRYILFN